MNMVEKEAIKILKGCRNKNTLPTVLGRIVDDPGESKDRKRAAMVLFLMDADYVKDAYFGHKGRPGQRGGSAPKGGGGSGNANAKSAPGTSSVRPARPGRPNNGSIPAQNAKMQSNGSNLSRNEAFGREVNKYLSEEHGPIATAKMKFKVSSQLKQYGDGTKINVRQRGSGLEAGNMVQQYVKKNGKWEEVGTNTVEGQKYDDSGMAWELVSTGKKIRKIHDDSVLDVSIEDGGPGSGNFGHAGRPGEVGGSAAEGEGGYSSEGESGSVSAERLSELRRRHNETEKAYKDVIAEENKLLNQLMGNGPIQPGQSRFGRKKEVDMDDVLRRVKEFEEERDVKRIKEEADRAKSEYEAANKQFEDEYNQREKAKEEEEISKSGLSEADYFRKMAIKQFGTTSRFQNAGYMMPDGRMLDFSGGSGTRIFDHRDIGQLFALEQGKEALTRFVNQGNIRILASKNDGGVNLSGVSEPTQSQYKMIKEMIRQYPNGFHIDIDDKSGRTVKSLTYEGRVSPEAIILDIQDWYRNGDKPKSNSRFSDFFGDSSPVDDGGEGSGNFGHSGRPGMVGGSGEGSGAVGRQDEYSTKIDSEISDIEDDADRARYLFEKGFLSYREAVDLMNSGNTQDVFDSAVEVLKKNGDPTPTKQLRKNESIADEAERLGDWDEARMNRLREWTGLDGLEAEEAMDQLSEWVGFNWEYADTETIDDYIDRDGAYDGELYRGIKLNDDEYEEFMSQMKMGSVIGMRGKNSSWSTDKETALTFAKGADKEILFHCKKNRTSAPIGYINRMGESEVVSHSKARWTVLGVEEGNARTVITLIETGEYAKGDESSHRVKDCVAWMQDRDEFAKLSDRIMLQGLFDTIESVTTDGGPGSGNFGHKGRPGQVGGSGNGGASYDPHGNFVPGTSLAEYRNKRISDEEREEFKKSVGRYVSNGYVSTRSMKQIDLDSYDKDCYAAVGKYVAEEITRRAKIRKKAKENDPYITDGQPQTDDIYDVLRDLRRFGIEGEKKPADYGFETTYSEIDPERTERIVKEALSRFPTDWLECLNESGCSIQILDIGGRSHCSYGTDQDYITVYAREHPEVVKDMNLEDDHLSDAAIVNSLVHEIAHHVEKRHTNGVGSIGWLMDRFREQRTEDDYLVEYAPGEYTKKDNFKNPYMGRIYPGYGNTTECLTVLMQSLGYLNPQKQITEGFMMDPGSKRDHESYRMIIGMLAGGFKNWDRE